MFRVFENLVYPYASYNEDDTQEELLALNRQYATFWARQSGGFIGTEKEATQ